MRSRLNSSESMLRQVLPEIYQTTNDRFNKAVWANAGTVATSPVLQVRLGTSGAYRVGDINFEREALSAETSQSPLASPSLRTNRTGRSVGSTVVSSRCQSPSAWNKMHLVADSAIGLLGLEEKPFPKGDPSAAETRRQQQRQVAASSSFDKNLPAGPNAWERSVASSPVGGLRWRNNSSYSRSDISRRPTFRFKHGQGSSFDGARQHEKTSMPFSQTWFHRG